MKIKISLVVLLASALFLFMAAQRGQQVILTRTIVGGGGSVAFLNTNTAFQVSAATYSGAATINTGGTNVVAFFPVCYDTGSGLSVSAITFNSVSIVSNTAGAVINDGVVQVSCVTFYYINPPTGSHTLNITTSGGAVEIYGNVIVFQGVNQTTPIRSGTYQTCSSVVGSCGGGTTTPTMTITSNVNDLTFSCIGPNNGANTTGTNQTSDGITNAGTNSFASDHATVAAATITDTWTIQNLGYAFIGFSIQHA